MPILVRRSRTNSIIGGLALIATGALVALVQHRIASALPGGDAAVALACAATLPGSLLGWLVARQPFSSAAMGSSLALAAWLIRLTVPLAAIGWLSRQPRETAAVSPAGYVLGAYLSLLAADIALHVALRREAASPPSGPPLSGGEEVAD